MTDQALTPDKEMLELLRAREKREAAIFEKQQKQELADEQARQFRKDTRKKNEEFEWGQIYKAQSLCDHRKGTSKSPKAKHIDYDVFRHTFANRVVVVKCLKCKHKSFPGDTKEKCWGTMDNYTRGDRSKMVKNPTRLSYAEWVAMTTEDNTTNKPSSAEIVTEGPQLATA